MLLRLVGASPLRIRAPVVALAQRGRARSAGRTRRRRRRPRRDREQRQAVAEGGAAEAGGTPSVRRLDGVGGLPSVVGDRLVVQGGELATMQLAVAGDLVPGLARARDRRPVLAGVPMSQPTPKTVMRRSQVGQEGLQPFDREREHARRLGPSGRRRVRRNAQAWSRSRRGWRTAGPWPAPRLPTGEGRRPIAVQKRPRPPSPARRSSSRPSRGDRPARWSPAARGAARRCRLGRCVPSGYTGSTNGALKTRPRGRRPAHGRCRGQQLLGPPCRDLRLVVGEERGLAVGVAHGVREVPSPYGSGPERSTSRPRRRTRSPTDDRGPVAVVQRATEEEQRVHDALVPQPHRRARRPTGPVVGASCAAGAAAAVDTTRSAVRTSPSAELDLHARRRLAQRRRTGVEVRTSRQRPRSTPAGASMIVCSRPGDSRGRPRALPAEPLPQVQRGHVAERPDRTSSPNSGRQHALPDLSP